MVGFLVKNNLKTFHSHLEAFQPLTARKGENFILCVSPVVGVTMAEVSPLMAGLAAGRPPVWRLPMGEM